MTTTQEHCQRCRYAVPNCKCKLPLLEAAAPRDPSDTSPLMTPAEVARLFRVDPKTVTRWAQAGRLRSVRTLGGHRRYRQAEVQALLEPRPVMSAHISFHGPYTFNPRAVAGSYTEFMICARGGDYVAIYLYTRADCDDLIKAATAARGLLPGPPGHPFARPGQVAPDRPAPDRCMVCARPENEHPAPELAPDPDVLNDAVTELPGHGENHISNDGQVVSAIHPGECIGCHGHATADGTWHPAMAS